MTIKVQNTMKFRSAIVLVFILTCFVTVGHAQKGNHPITNGISVFGGITQFDVVTDNFITQSGNGFLGGTLATVDIPMRWYNVSFGMQLSENTLGILGRPTQGSTQNEFIDYKLFAAQVAMLLHIKVIPNYFTIDVGPMLQYNSKLELKDDAKETYYIANYNALTAMDIVDISQFNFNGAVGASVGIKNLKIKGQYLYGFTNMLNKLETKGLDTTGGDARFKGNQSLLFLGIQVSF